MELYPEALTKAERNGFLPLHILLYNTSSSVDDALMMIEQYPAVLKHQDNHDDYLPLHIECIMKCRSYIISKCIELYPESLAMTNYVRYLPLHNLLGNESSSIEDALMMIEKYPAALQHQDNYDQLPLHIECFYPCKSIILSKCVELYPEALTVADWKRCLPLYRVLVNIMSSIEDALMVIEKYPAAVNRVVCDNCLPIHIEYLRQNRAIIVSKCIQLYPERLDDVSIAVVIRKINECNFHSYASVLLVVFTHLRMSLYHREVFNVDDIRKSATTRRRILHLLPRHVFTPTHESDYRDLNWKCRVAMIMLLTQMKRIMQQQSRHHQQISSSNSNMNVVEAKHVHVHVAQPITIEDDNTSSSNV
jgi:hypothetical protein